MHVEIFIIAKTNHPEDPDEIMKENPTEEVEVEVLEDPALDNSDSLSRVLTNLNQNMDHMASSLSAMGEAFVALSKQCPAKRDTRSGTLDPLNGETKKPRVDAGDAVETGSESDDSDVQELLATSAENDSEGTKTSSAKMQDSCNNEGKDDLLKKLALQSVISLITPTCYMASVDLKDAYYCVPIAVSDQKYLKFEWGGKLYQFTCFPNGLASCPRKFTKLTKPAYCFETTWTYKLTLYS